MGTPQLLQDYGHWQGLHGVLVWIQKEVQRIRHLKVRVKNVSVRIRMKGMSIRGAKVGGNKSPYIGRGLGLDTVLSGPYVFGSHLKPARICWCRSSIVLGGEHGSHPW